MRAARFATGAVRNRWEAVMIAAATRAEQDARAVQMGRSAASAAGRRRPGEPEACEDALEASFRGRGNGRR